MSLLRSLLHRITLLCNPDTTADRDTIQQLIRKTCSGVIRIEYLNKEKKTIGSGTGFISNKFLITNNHVYVGAQDAAEVKLSWQPDITNEEIQSIIVNSVAFQNSFQSGSDKNNKDYAILRITELTEKNLYDFNCDPEAEINIGDEALIMGFPFEHVNIVCHRAMVSSSFTKKDVKVIQLDASVNQSNSGGPLIDPQSGSVIGIVTRKGTGLSELFDTLIKSFDNNIQALTRIRGAMTIGNIDPVQALIASQHQMKLVSREIERSANVGIGYAFSIKYVSSEIKFLLNKND